MQRGPQRRVSHQDAADQVLQAVAAGGRQAGRAACSHLACGHRYRRRLCVASALPRQLAPTQPHRRRCSRPCPSPPQRLVRREGELGLHGALHHAGQPPHGVQLRVAGHAAHSTQRTWQGRRSAVNRAEVLLHAARSCCSHTCAPRSLSGAHPKGYRPTTITYSSTPHDQMSTFCGQEQACW